MLKACMISKLLNVRLHSFAVYKYLYGKDFEDDLQQKICRRH